MTAVFFADLFAMFKFVMASQNNLLSFQENGMSQMVKRKKSAVGVGSAETSSLLMGGQGLPPGGALGSANSDILVLSDGQGGQSEIKRCPMCFVPIERDAGCAQMMCKRCKHVFCWFCLASLDVSIFLSSDDNTSRLFKGRNDPNIMVA